MRDCRLMGRSGGMARTGFGFRKKVLSVPPSLCTVFFFSSQGPQKIRLGSVVFGRVRGGLSVLCESQLIVAQLQTSIVGPDHLASKRSTRLRSNVLFIFAACSSQGRGASAVGSVAAAVTSQGFELVGVVVSV